MSAGRGIDLSAACGVALRRRNAPRFDALVRPMLKDFIAGKPLRVPELTLQIAERIPPDERDVLLPALEAATSLRADGRDRLHGLVCQSPAYRKAAPCQIAKLEETWARRARFRRLAPRVAVLVVVAMLGAWGVSRWRRRASPRT